GKTFRGVRSEEADVTEEGYTIVLNREKINPQCDPLMPILLHEVTHALDPRFDEDMKVREEHPDEFKDWKVQYGLASELRAFAAMWTEDLREDLERDQYQNPGASLLQFRQRSDEFNGFYAYGLFAKHDLIAELEDHVSKIVEDLTEMLASMMGNGVKTVIVESMVFVAMRPLPPLLAPTSPFC